MNRETHKSPQFESVNDWATVNEFSHYSAQCKLMQLKPADATTSPSLAATFTMNQQAKQYNYLLEKRPKTMLELSEHLNALLSRTEPAAWRVGSGKRYLSQNKGSRHK